MKIEIFECLDNIFLKTTYDIHVNGNFRLQYESFEKAKEVADRIAKAGELYTKKSIEVIEVA